MSKLQNPKSTENTQTNKKRKIRAVLIISLPLFVLGVALYFLVVFGLERGVIMPSKTTALITRVKDKKSFKVQEEESAAEPERVVLEEVLEEEGVDVTVMDYTSQINDICQELIITAKIKNLLDFDINFSDIFDENGYMFLDVVCEELEERMPFFATAKDWTGVKMTDFGVISPGEEAEIELVVIDEVQIIDESGNPLEVIYENPFTTVEQNGIYSLRLELGMEVGRADNEFYDGPDYILGKSNTFPVEVNVLSEPGFYKACANSNEV